MDLELVIEVYSTKQKTNFVTLWTVEGELRTYLWIVMRFLVFMHRLFFAFLSERDINSVIPTKTQFNVNSNFMQCAGFNLRFASRFASAFVSQRILWPSRSITSPDLRARFTSTASLFTTTGCSALKFLILICFQRIASTKANNGAAGSMRIEIYFTFPEPVAYTEKCFLLIASSLKRTSHCRLHPTSKGFEGMKIMPSEPSGFKTTRRNDSNIFSLFLSI